MYTKQLCFKVRSAELTQQKVFSLYATHTYGTGNCSERKLILQRDHHNIFANITQIVTLPSILCRPTQ